ncbi:hypothetical protein [Bifidobacterium biavatii]|uniref:ABC transporter ATP-binding protein n=1 Tax=Bifidobacterium biavatii DSM 23969 TaxID=1437608 RepID=A0A086ZW41_9BIFI|nr:hypothetical protein [Bifidobacterium biavatii]KFI50741.1 ABC transporter ATP-binding protein [Bifidobacterium biavatii DSM 23969]
MTESAAIPGNTPAPTRATADVTSPSAAPSASDISESRVKPGVAANVLESAASTHEPANSAASSKSPLNPAEWTGDWISFEQLINSREPALERAWTESEAAMRAHRSAFTLMLPFFGGSIRRFWRWACRTTCRENRHAPIAGWHIEPLEYGENAGNGFALEWRSGENTVIGRYAYQLDHMIDRGLEGKPCYVFHADSAPEGSPFRVLIAMDPMPSRAEQAVLDERTEHTKQADQVEQAGHEGLLSHLHFQYGSSEAALLRGGPNAGAAAKLRHRMWYPTMCAGDGDLLAQCNVVRALHKLPLWERLPEQ